MATLCFIVGVLSFVIACHPFTTYPWSLALLRRLPPKRRRAVSPPTPDSLNCAVCVCAYNEERVIERKVQNLLALREYDPDLQSLVYVDAATDDTTDILRRYARDIDLCVGTERRGKTYGMNVLAARARASILVFSDANVMMDGECVCDFKRHFADPEIGCVNGSLVYTNGTASATASSGSYYWRFEEALKKLEMETGSMMGADGSVFAVRRSLHKPPPEHIIDDMYVSLMVLCSGYRVIQASDARAYEESVTSAKEELKRKVRIACQAFNVHRLIWPQLRQLDRLTLYKYVSHKLMRWFTIYLLGLSALAFEAAMVVAGYWHAAAAVTGCAAIALMLGFFWSVKPFAQMAQIVAAFAGTGVGVWRSLRGERYQTWNPATSIRR